MISPSVVAETGTGIVARQVGFISFPQTFGESSSPALQRMSAALSDAHIHILRRSGTCRRSDCNGDIRHRMRTGEPDFLVAVHASEIHAMALIPFGL